MVIVVQCFDHDRKIWESTWTLDTPPSRHQAWSNLTDRDADEAIILDDDGFELFLKERQKYDA
jgi:hypothetical protein